MNYKISRVAALIAVAVIAMPVPTISTPAPAFAAEVQAIATPGSSSKTTDAFDPNPININVGDTVVWTNEDSIAHTVTSGTGPEDPSSGQEFDSSPNFSPLWVPKDTFSHTFTEAGEFPYYCALHPNMVGTVIVSAGSNGGEPTESTATTEFDGKSYTVTAVSAETSVTAVEIVPNELVRLQFDGPGKVELTLPTSMISGISAVTLGGSSVDFEEVDSSGDSTTISFTVPDSGSVEITGATVVPEFGVIAALVLAVSLVAVIGIARFKGSLFGLGRF